MKFAALSLIIIFLLPLGFCKASWDDTSKLDKALSYKEKEAFNGKTAQDADLKSGLESLLKNAKKTLREKLLKACASSFKILCVCAACGIAKGYAEASDSKISLRSLDLAAALSVSLLVLKNGIAAQSLNIVERLCEFSKILTPTFAVACAVAKHPSAAVSTGTAALLFTDIVTFATKTYIFPLIIFYAAGSIFSGAAENPMISKACGVLKWIIVTFYRVLLIVFTFYITFSGVISAGADALSVKTARLFISGSVPVIGGVIADASDTILSGAILLKNSIGVFGLLGVCGICLVPFLSVFAHFLCFKVLSFFGGAIGGKSVSEILCGATNAYALCLSALAACSAVQFISIVVSSAVTIS